MKTSMTPTCTMPTALALVAALALLPAPARADEALRTAVVALAAERGPAYVAARDEIVAQGEAALPELDRLAAGEDWRVAAAARACAGWIRNGETYRLFVDDAPVVTAAGTMRYTRGPVPYDDVLVPLLVERLLWTEEDGIRRVAVAELLRRLRAQSATPALGWVLQHDEDLGVRRGAAEALERAPDDEAGEILIRALRTEGDPSVRVATAAALGARKDPGAVGVLLETLAYDSAGECRAQAAQSLGWICDQEALSGLLRALFQDADPGVRGAAALALGKLGGEHAEEALEKARKKDRDPEVRRLASVALERIE